MTLTKIETGRQLLLAARRTLRGCAGLAIVGALLPACGEPNPGEQEQTTFTGEGSSEQEASLTRTAADTSSEVLHELTTADGQTFTFTLLPSGGGSPGEIVISDQYFDVDHYSALTEQYGQLTALETFLAFAPQGMDPHPALVAAHESEARALGRAGDLAVKIVDGLGPEVLVEKTIPAVCQANSFYQDSLILPLRWRDGGPNFLVSVNNVEIFGCIGNPPVSGVGNPTGCEKFGAGALLRMYACNDSLSLAPMESRFFTESGGEALPEGVAPGGTRRVTRNPFSPPPGPVIARTLAVRVKNTNGGGKIIGGMGSL